MNTLRTWLCLAGAMLIGACAETPPPAPAPAAPTVRLAVAQTDRGVLVWLPDNVLFEFGRSDLATASGEYLDKVAHLIIEKTDRQVALEGHTDNVGAAEINQPLSERRARAIAAALRARGVPDARMQVAGFGFKRPLAPNDTELGRRINRRVEVIVLDETVEHLMRDEPAGAFEDAFARLKRELESQLPAPGSAK